MAHGEYRVPLNSFLATLYLLQAKMIIVGMTKELMCRRNIRD
jgi:hypothetical protein